MVSRAGDEDAVTDATDDRPRGVEFKRPGIPRGGAAIGHGEIRAPAGAPVLVNVKGITAIEGRCWRVVVLDGDGGGGLTCDSAVEVR